MGTSSETDRPTEVCKTHQKTLTSQPQKQVYCGQMYETRNLS